jgi:hypothetical protein
MKASNGVETRLEWMRRQGDVRPLGSLVSVAILACGASLFARLGPSADVPMKVALGTGAVAVYLWWIFHGGKPLNAWYQSRYGISVEGAKEPVRIYESFAGCPFTAIVIALVPFWLARQFGQETEAIALLPAVWCLTRWRFSRHAAHWGLMAIISSAISCASINALPSEVTWIVLFPILGYLIDQLILDTHRIRLSRHRSAHLPSR